MRVFLLLLVLGALTAQGLSGRRRTPGAGRGRAFTFLLAALTLASAARITPQSFTAPFGDSFLRGWNAFHYYLGAKYFREVGYFDLYACALEADRRGKCADEGAAPLWSGVSLARDLRSYEIVMAKSIPPCPPEGFTASRRRQFEDDLCALRRLSGESLEDVISDKGFNPTPFWAALVSVPANGLTLEASPAARAFFNLDLLFFLCSLLLVYLTFGAGAALWLALFLIFYFGTYQRLWGNTFQYLWFFFVIAGTAGWCARRVRTSAFSWAAAVLLQLFPLFLLSGPMVLLGASWLRGRKEEQREYARFFFYFFAFAALLLAGGFLLGATGPRWAQMYENIKIHSHYLTGELFNVGLKNLIATAAHPGGETVYHYVMDFTRVASRLHAFEGLKIWYALALLAGLSLFIFLLSRVVREGGTAIGAARDPAIFAVGLLPMYLLVSVSPYYYLCLGLFLLPRRRSRTSVSGEDGTVREQEWRVVLSRALLFFLLLAHALLFPVSYLSLAAGPHLVSEVLILLSLALLLLLRTPPAGEDQG